MSQEHVKALGRLLSVAASGRFAVERDVRFKEGDLSDARYNLLDRQGVVLAGMTVRSLPGCCGVCLLHTFNGKRPADVSAFIKIAVTAARRSRYGLVSYTLQSKSEVLALSLLHFKPEEVVTHEFRNGKTNRLITAVLVNLKQQVEDRPVSHLAGE